MRVLIVPMFALSRMGGPWSRAQAIADAFARAGHEAVLGVAPDGNCIAPRVLHTFEMPAPSPLGLPMAIASRTFPLATKLGIVGRKPVHSYEEVLWLTGNLAPSYVRESVDLLRDFIERAGIDAVYSEFSIPAIIAARLADIPVFGSHSYPTQASYASAPAKAKGLRKLLGELGLPDIDSSLELFTWLEERFVPSCPELEPFDGGVTFTGFMGEPPELGDAQRNVIVVYLGSGSVPAKAVEPTVLDAFSDSDVDVFVAGTEGERSSGNVHFAPRFDFRSLLPRASLFVHHGGQNSVMDALAYGAPQVIVPGKVFERLFNAESVERAGAGIKLDRFDAASLVAAYERIQSSDSYVESALELRKQLVSLGGADTIVSAISSRMGS
ncbi:MAG: glycosyl transferase [bacterium]|nr:glycosyl transferase [bacterium]